MVKKCQDFNVFFHFTETRFFFDIVRVRIFNTVCDVRGNVSDEY